MRHIITTTLFSALLFGGPGPSAVSPLSAQSQPAPDAIELADSLSRMIHRGAITSDLELLRQARTLAERALVAHPGHVLLEHHLAETYYREATHLADEDMDAAQPLLEQAQEVLDETVRREGVPAETHALRGSVIGMRITSMLKGMTLGPKASSALETAMALDPTSPRVWLAQGISTLHSPGFMGGGADAAIEELERGLALVEHDRPERGHPIGGEAELWAWLGIAHLRADRPADALAAYRRALEVEAEFGWVRQVLLPQAQAATR